MSRNTWAQEIYYLMLAAEDYLQIGETVILTQTPFNQIRGFSYTFPALEGFYAIYNAESRVVAEVSYDGKEYTMNMKYYIFDYYDWDRDIEIPVGFVTPKELYKLCKCGAARAYENWGLYEKQIKWIADTQERDDVLKKEKMILCFETNITNIPLW